MKAAQRVQPRFLSVAGRTWLTYPDLADPDLLHGIVVFRDFRPCISYARWTGEARSYFDHDNPLSGIPVLFGRQVHGSRVGKVTRSEAAIGPEEGRCGRGALSERGFRIEPVGNREFDALVTSERGVALAVTVSDCLPLFATSASAIGVAHCGWRGIAAGVVQEFVRALGPHATGAARFLIGAGIGPCCYEVKEDMIAAFGEDAAEYCVRDRGRITFDLRAAVTDRLVASGVSPDRILIDQTCTSCKKDVLSSYRAEAGDCGRMVAFLARREQLRSEREVNPKVNR